MFVITLSRTSLKKLGLGAMCCALVVCSALLGRYISTRTVTAAASVNKIESAQDIQTWFTGYGLEVDGASITADKVKIPANGTTAFRFQWGGAAERHGSDPLQGQNGGKMDGPDPGGQQRRDQPLRGVAGMAQKGCGSLPAGAALRRGGGSEGLADGHGRSPADFRRGLQRGTGANGTTRNWTRSRPPGRTTAGTGASAMTKN